MATRGEAWSQFEVEAAVEDYFHMLTLELAGQTYNKTAHRHRLAQRLEGQRSEGSIERKHQNISAVLLELGWPYIVGYKPLPNFQGLLLEVIAQRIQDDHDELDRLTLDAIQRPAATPSTPDFNKMLVAAPISTGARSTANRAEEERTPYRLPEIGVFRDYVAREAANRSLGAAGETLILALERYRLDRAGKPDLSERVEQVSVTRGDGLGYDILSFEPSGKERFIEVKTTSFGQMTPFFLTRSELERSRQCAEQFLLCRVFSFRHQPRLFELPGEIEKHCRLDPASYRVRLC